MRILVDYIDGTHDEEEITNDCTKTIFTINEKSQSFAFASYIDKTVIEYPIAFIKKIRIEE